MSEFFRTRMGHCFYESTMPSLVHELARLNQNLERLLAVVEGATPVEPAIASKPKEPR